MTNHETIRKKFLNDRLDLHFKYDGLLFHRIGKVLLILFIFIFFQFQHSLQKHY